MAKLTKKQKGFVKDYLDTGNATESAERNYNVKDRDVARSIGSENLTKPDIRAYLADKSNDAVSMVYTLSQTAENEGVRLNASKDILDRAGYKPVDKSEVKVDDKTEATLKIKNIANIIDDLHRRGNLTSNGVETDSMDTQASD